MVGGAKKVSKTYKPFLVKEIQFGMVLSEWLVCCKNLRGFTQKSTGFPQV
jgi:hypothetical protein